MNDDKALRQTVVNLLKGGQAYVTAKQALEDLNEEVINIHPKEDIHSIWQELEHMRIAQEDILKYIVDPFWKSPKWPDMYWPSSNEKVTWEKWEGSVSKFNLNLNELVDLTINTKIDLNAQIPHGDPGHTYLREILLAADHNAYHIGQIVLIRKLLNEWEL
jgi:DinB superfamily